MRGKYFFILVCILAFAFLVSAETIQDDLHLNIQVVDVGGNVLTGNFDFQFDIATDNTCSNVVYSDSVNLNTDSRGIISYYLEATSMGYGEQYYLCYYRDSVLIDTVQIARTPYSFTAKNVNVSGVIVDSNFDVSGFNVSADYFIGSARYLTDLNVSSLNMSEYYTKSEVESLNSDLNNSLRGWVDSFFIRISDLSSLVGNWSFDKPNYYNKTEVEDLVASGDVDSLGGYNASFFMPLNKSVHGDFDFNSGWTSGGVSIIDGSVYAQSGYFYDINALSVTNLEVNGSMVPDLNAQFDLGSNSMKWRDAWFSRSLNVAGTVVNSSDVCLDDGTCLSSVTSGSVQGPASSTDNAIARFNGVSGELIQNSGVTIDDSNNLITAGEGRFQTAGILLGTAVRGRGVSFGTAMIDSVTASDITFSGLSQFRFGSSTTWNYNEWAGIKYDSATHYLYIGGPNSTQFTSNANPQNANVIFDGVNYVQVNGDLNATGDICINGGACLSSVESSQGDYVLKSGDTMTGDLTVGDISRTSHTYVRALAGDLYNAGFEAYGSAQGTGYFYVGQSSSYGGGVFYNGDGNPSFATGEAADRISFYRVANNVKEVVFSYSYNTNDVAFRGPISSTGAISGTTINTGYGAFEIGQNLRTTDSVSFVRVNATTDVCITGGNCLSDVSTLDMITGAGTSMRVPLWNGTMSLNNSNIYQGVAGRIGIGVSSPSSALDVLGDIRLSGELASRGYVVKGHSGAAINNLASGISVSGSGSGSVATDGSKNVGVPYLSFGAGSGGSGPESVYIQIDLGEAKTVSQHKIYFYNGDNRYYWFRLKYSYDGVNWHYAVGNSDEWVKSAPGLPGTTPNGQIGYVTDVRVDSVNARYWRLYADGNTINTGNHIYEWEIFQEANPSSLDIDNRLNVGGAATFVTVNASSDICITGGNCLSNISSGGGDSLWENISGVATYYGSANVTGSMVVGSLNLSDIVINRTSFDTKVGYLAGYQNTGTHQTALGYLAGYQNTGDYLQLAIGSQAGYQNAGDFFQIAIGYQSGYQNTGEGQTALGYWAGYGNTGDGQVVIGGNAGRNNTGMDQSAFGEAAGFYNAGSVQSAFGNGAGQLNTGTHQTAIGYNSGYNNSGTYQIAIGNQAGYQNTANGQVAMGYRAGYQNTGLSQSVFGYDAGYQNTGSSQSAFGNGAGYGNTANYQTAIGSSAGRQNTGLSQSAFGYNAGYGNTANYQTAIGYQAGYSNNQSNQVAVGHQAGYDNAGSYQTAIGYQAGYLNYGHFQTVVGQGAGTSNTALEQIAVGYNSGLSNTGRGQIAIGIWSGQYNAAQSQIAIGSGRWNTGDYQVAIGTVSGDYNTGDFQTALGYYAGYNNSGYNQLALGSEAGRKNTGDYQTVLGFWAGYENTGDYQTALGFFAGRSNSANNQIAIGYDAGRSNSGANSIFIGRGVGVGNTVSDRLMIDNINTATPLIDGDFATDTLTIHGDLNVTGNIDVGGCVRYNGGTLGTCI